MICLNCGRNINVISRDCPYCHAPINMNSVSTMEIQTKTKEHTDAKDNKLLLESIIFPIGIYFYIKNKEKFPLKASSALGGSLIGIIILLAFTLTIILTKVL